MKEDKIGKAIQSVYSSAKQTGKDMLDLSKKALKAAKPMGGNATVPEDKK